MQRPTSLILRRLAEVGNSTVAKSIGKDESKLSRFTANSEGLKLEDFDAFFQTLGLELWVSSSDNILIQRATLESLRTLAREYLTQPIELKTRAEDKSEA